MLNMLKKWLKPILDDIWLLIKKSLMGHWAE